MSDSYKKYYERIMKNQVYIASLHDANDSKPARLRGGACVITWPQRTQIHTALLEKYPHSQTSYADPYNYVIKPRAGMFVMINRDFDNFHKHLKQSFNAFIALASLTRLNAGDESLANTESWDSTILGFADVIRDNLKEHNACKWDIHEQGNSFACNISSQFSVDQFNI